MLELLSFPLIIPLVEVAGLASNQLAKMNSVRGQTSALPHKVSGVLHPVHGQHIHSGAWCPKARRLDVHPVRFWMHSTAFDAADPAGLCTELSTGNQLKILIVEPGTNDMSVACRLCIAINLCT
ncbi:TPA: hypothetical protein ACH3X1_012519 [Trebouxia sp. C0004]